MIKNILYYNEAVPLESLYVPLDFSSERWWKTKLKLLTDIAILSEFTAPRNFVICATAGSGKSFFLRKALLTLSVHTGHLVPILLELRSLNGKAKANLADMIAFHTKEFVPSFMPEQIKLGLESGIFALLLDGFDEIEPELSDHYEAEILALATRFPNTPLMVSTRPIERVLAWQNFKCIHVQPLTKEAAIQLVEKLDFDAAVKSKFISEIRGDLYSRHKSFLSNPLLVTMMLLTFSETAEIDNKLSRFYADAFNALLVRHDAKKEAFKRSFVSGVGKEEFLNLFAAFCFLTYSRNLYAFDQSRAIEAIRWACDLQDLTSRPEDVFHDFCVTSCMLIKEGNDYVFSHRSFQEYFCAVFISRCPPDIAKKLLNEIASIASIGSRFLTDNVLKLLLELNPELVEMNWVLPRLKAITAHLKKVPRTEYVRQYSSSFFLLEEGEFAQGEGRALLRLKGKMGLALFVLGRLYGLPVYEYVDIRLVSRGHESVTPRSSGFLVEVSTKPDAAINIPDQLFALEERISVSYARRKTKLESIVRKTRGSK